MLLSSSLPFYGSDKLVVMKKILFGRFSFTAKRWAYVSEPAQTFVLKLLSRDAAKRPSADQALKLPWINLPRKQSVVVDRMEDIQASIQAYSSYGTLKKLALLVVAHKSTSEEIGFLRKMFGAFDTSNDGEISYEEFCAAMSENYNYTENELQTLYRGINIDGTGKVHYKEFLAATMEAHGPIDEERLAEAFDRIDHDDSGTITIRDLGDFLGDGSIPDAHLERILSEADIDNDKNITYDEFLALWNDGSVWEQARASVGSKRLDFSMNSQELLENLEDGTDFFHLHKEMSFRNEKVVDLTSRQEL
jgi:calcium-dependent protein kinase